MVGFWVVGCVVFLGMECVDYIEVVVFLGMECVDYIEVLEEVSVYICLF